MIDTTLAHEFGLEIPNAVSEGELLRALEARLDFLMRSDALRLLQILYRMDVDERAAEAAMEDTNAAGSLACLILQRTKTRAASRLAFRPPPVRDEDADLVL